MTEVSTPSTRILDQLDWKFTPPCEIVYGWPEQPQQSCDEAASKWLTFVNGLGAVTRKLACDQCVARVLNAGRLIEVRKL